MIKRKFILDSRGHYRYYSARYNPDFGRLKGFERPKSPIVDLEIFTNITTEKQLMKGIFNEFGPGHYLIFAFIKGKKGTWVFWKGLINEDGFLREKRVTNYKRAITKLKYQMVAADEDEQEDIKEEMQIEKEFREPDSMYGLQGHLKPSSKIGQFTSWEDADMILQQKQSFDDWDGGQSKKELEDAEWGTDVSRSKKNKDQFEVWK